MACSHKRLYRGAQEYGLFEGYAKGGVSVLHGAEIYAAKVNTVKRSRN